MNDEELDLFTGQMSVESAKLLMRHQLDMGLLQLLTVTDNVLRHLYA